MKALKYLAIGLVGIVALLAAALIFIAMNFDPARVKAELSKAMLEKHQRILKIDGDLSLSVWPSIGVKVGQISLSEPSSDLTFASLDAARVSLRVLPLLHKQIVVDQIELAGLRVVLLQHQDGQLNIADLLAKPQEGKVASQAEQQGDAAMPEFDIAGIRLSNAQLTWHNEASGQIRTLRGVNLTTGHLANAAQGKLELSATLAGDKPADAVNLQLAADYDYDLEKRRFALGQLDANLASSQRGVDARLALHGLEGSPQALKIARLDLLLEANTGETAIKGKLESPLSADLSAQTVELPNISGELAIAGLRQQPEQVKLPLSAKLHADLGKQSAAVTLNTQFDETRLAASVNLAKFAPLDLGFDLDIDKLNLDRYLPAKQSQQQGEKGQAQAAATEAKLDFSALKTLNLHGTIMIGALQAHRIKVANLRVNLRAAGGQLDLAPHTASLYNGTLSGALSMNANGNRIVARENLSGISINPLLKDAANQDLLEGQGNVTLDIATQGETVSALRKALRGSASINLKDGAIKGINLAQAFREAKAKISGKQDAVQAARSTEKTDFAELAASFRISNGVASNNDLSVKSPFLRLSGAGDIDIGQGAIDYLAKASIVNTSDGQGAQELGALKGLTIPVRVSGTFDKLSYKLEFASLAQEAVKAKVAETQQEIQKKAQGALTDKLKNLFGK